MLTTAFALLCTLAAALLSSTAAALWHRVRTDVQQRRRLQARAEEAALVAAAVQRWAATPDAWGGGASAGIARATLDAVGLANRPLAPGVYATQTGCYRVVPVPPCAQLDRAAARMATEAPVGGGLLVVGTGGASEDAVAVLVLGPLVQVALERVPWAWIRPLRAVPVMAAPAGTLAETRLTDAPEAPVIGSPAPGPRLDRAPRRHRTRRRPMPPLRSPRAPRSPRASPHHLAREHLPAHAALLDDVRDSPDATPPPTRHPP